VWVGCEAKVLDVQGRFDAGPEILNQCNIVLGSVHRFPDERGGWLDFAAVPQRDFSQIEFELARGLLEAAPIDVLAHPGGMYARRFKADLPAGLLRELLVYADRRGIAVEINSSYLQDLPGFLALCAEINPVVSIGSDVHRAEKLGHCRDLLTAQRVGIA
jgi:putative hydrolase